MKIAFIDTLGLAYDGSTLSKRGLGGSESAIILISRELAKIGFEVDVFNDCLTDDASPGIYDSVTYRPLKEVEEYDDYDIVIGSRSAVVFAPDSIRNEFKTFLDYMPSFEKITRNAKLKILYCHDTFIDGDQIIEDLLLQGRINEIFTLSDFHTSYVTNSDHGKKRIFEIMKPYIYQTRNGINRWIDWVDINKKDPNLFVYNSSLTKGMIPLVEQVWPRVKQQCPDAKLMVIGGYYRFREGVGPDAQESRWRELVEKYGNTNDITFTGVIPQSQIAEILAAASYMIYPCDFPETFGISALESLAYNTPLITCRFGALEETAFDLACYKIPYSVVPNWSVPWLDQARQVDIFCGAVINAYNNKYLHQQKMYACNQVRGIEGWDTVALQWKQHFFKKTGNFLPVDEYRKVSKINNQVRRVFGRRFINEEEIQAERVFYEHDILVVSPVYNAEKYIAKNILSVAQQDYDSYKHVIINDASTDNTAAVIEQTLKTLPDELREKFEVIHREKNMGAVYNIVETVSYEEYGYGDIVMLLDGDDWLINDPNIFHKYNNLYNDGAAFTYGSCWSLADNIPLIAQPYPPEVKANKSYRDYKFNWNMPYTHLRTFSSRLLRYNLDKSKFKDENGEWLRAGGDTSIFYGCIEQLHPDEVVCVPDIVMNYNDLNPLNDYKVNGDEQTRTANMVLNRVNEQIPSNKFSVIVPTMWRCVDIFTRMLNDLQAHPLIDEILIIDNDPEQPHPAFLELPKVRFVNKIREQPNPALQTRENIGVNPALNLGVLVSKNDRLCLINDDVWFDTAVFDKLVNKLKPGAGIFGIIDGDPKLLQPAPTDYSIDFINWQPADCIHSFGQMMFIHKDDWCMIPEGMKISFGDEFQLHSQTINNRPITLIYNIRQEVLKSATVKDLSIPLNTGETYLEDQRIYQEWAAAHPINLPHKEYVPLIDRALQMKKVQQVLTTPINELPTSISPSTPLNIIPLDMKMADAGPIFSVAKKKILIGIPTARYIEVETFKAIYDLEIPEGYEADFQYFYGYSRCQIRNLMCEWTKQYDYMLMIKQDTIINNNILYHIIKETSDLVSIDSFAALYMSRNVVTTLAYPYFEQADTEKEEMLNFTQKVLAAGMSYKNIERQSQKITSGIVL